MLSWRQRQDEDETLKISKTGRNCLCNCAGLFFGYDSSSDLAVTGGLDYEAGDVDRSI